MNSNVYNQPVISCIRSMLLEVICIQNHNQAKKVEDNHEESVHTKQYRYA